MNNFTQAFFSKDLYDINENDVIDFFKNIQVETTYLEFKSGEVSLEKIYNEVVALHNSEGGLVIIGSPKPKKDKEGNEFFEGELTRSIHKNKDWLYQKICNYVSPMPVGIKIHDIFCLDSGIIQIIEIPKSINPPHQSLSDGVYYLRFETQTRFAPHGFVEALFNKRKSPIIEVGNLSLGTAKKDDKFFARFLIDNLSDIPILEPHYIIDFYNVKKIMSFDDVSRGERVEGALIDIVKLDNFNSKAVALVKGMSIDIDNKIEHNNEAFFISGAFWGSNVNLKRKIFIVCPLNYLYREIDISENEGVFETVEINIKDILQKNNDIDTSGMNKLLVKLENIIRK